MNQKLTTQQYYERLNKANPNLELIGEYKTKKQQITLKCKKCGFTFTRYPNKCGNFKCPNCEPSLRGKVKQLSNEDFLKRLSEISPNIQPLEEYTNISNKIRVKCLIDNYEWLANPRDLLLKRTGCPKCGKNAKRTTADLIKDLKEIDDSLTVMGEYQKSNIKIKVKCAKCGKEWMTTPNNLLSGKGCKDCKTKGIYPFRLHKIFVGMLQRCYNDKNPKYKNYGGRGIQVCEEWKENRELFFKWAIENGYSEGLTIDRIDNNGNYSPENCRWVTMKIQHNNKTTTIYMTYHGETKPLMDWCKIFDLNPDKLRYYKKHGKEDEKNIDDLIAAKKTNRGALK